VQGFDDRLWTRSWRKRRSREFTPLYIERYRGPRGAQRLTSHRWWEFTCVLSGTGLITGPQQVALAPDCVCLIPPRHPHTERADSYLETIWIGFLMNHPPALTIPVAVRHAALSRAAEQLWLLAQQRGEPIGPELDAATAAFLAQFLRLHASGTQDATLMERAVRHLEQHFAETIFVDELARQFGCSAGYFHRRFKEHTGLPPTAYLLRLRVQRAAHLLAHTAWPVAEIARQVGFEDPYYFSRVFRKLMGHAPVTYRATSHNSARRGTAQLAGEIDNAGMRG
jgi:AraC-like DNA-binding protein